ncbi:exonuclease domain-containing protein [Chloroflexota bacterium]
MLKNLKLERPMVFIDVETTGVRPHIDRIVELSLLKVNPDGSEEYKSHRVNPGVPIPAETTAIHGITDADVAEEPMFRQYAKSLRDFLDDCDIGGFNVIGFDLPFFEVEFRRAGIEFSSQDSRIVDSMVIFHIKESRDLEAAYLKYCGKDLKNAHCAEEDAKASAEVLDGQMEMYQDLPRDITELSAMCNRIEGDYIDSDGKFIWVEGFAVCNFGKKHRGQRLEDIASDDPSYLIWIAGSDFSNEVKELVSNALKGEFPKP